MVDLCTDLSNCVVFEIFPEITEEDFDLLILFLESRKQSGGGDIMNLETLTYSSLENKKKIKICFEDNQVAQRMISKKFLKFKNYFLRALKPNFMDYRKDDYDLFRSKLIIKNIPIDSQEDDSIVHMYAEYLSPDNDIAHVQKSHLSLNTFYVTYKNDLNKESLIMRYNKKPKLRNCEIKLLDSFSTNSLIVLSEDKNQNFSQVIDKVNTELSSREGSQNYFMELNQNFVLFQFENEKILNELNDSIKIFINKNHLKFVVEKVFNFDLLSDYSVNVPVKQVLAKKKFADASTQTENLTNEYNESILNQNRKGSINHNQKHLRNSQPSSMRSSISESSSCISSNYSNSTKLDSAIQLDTNEYYSVALINTKQLFINFQDELRKLDKKLELINANNQLIIRYNGEISNNDWRLKVMVAINDFFEKKASHKTIKIPEDLLNNANLMQILTSKLVEFNKFSSAYYFRIYNQEIECYGCKKALLDKLNELNDLLKSLKNPSFNVKKSENDIQPTNSVQNDPSRYEIYPESLVYQSLLNLRQIMFDFKNNVRPLNAHLHVLNEEKRVFLTCLQLPDPDWKTKIRNFLNEFEKNQVKKASIPIPVNLRNNKDLESLIMQIKKIEQTTNTVIIEVLNNNLIQMYGYVKAVDKTMKEINSRFKNMQGNSKQRISNKLNIAINCESKSLEFEILKGFNGKYFKELSDNLEKVQASLAAYHVNEKNNGFKILCNLDKNDQKNEQKVDEWQSKVTKCRKDFMNKFSKNKIQLSNGRVAPSKLDYDSSQVNLKWITANEAEIIGIKTEVKKLVDKLTGNSNESNQNQVKKDNEKETFLINDLKWFQTRILFEKQYFKYLADNFKDLNVLLDTQLTRICFTGSKMDIEKAKDLAFDILGKILGAEVECDPITLNKMTQSENLYTNLLKEKKLCCVIDSKSHRDRFTIYTTDIADIEKCKMILSKLKF